MNIIEQNEQKINGIFSTFDRMIINGYILPLQNPRLFQMKFPAASYGVSSPALS